MFRFFTGLIVELKVKMWKTSTKNKRKGVPVKNEDRIEAACIKFWGKYAANFKQRKKKKPNQI